MKATTQWIIDTCNVDMLAMHFTQNIPLSWFPRGCHSRVSSIYWIRKCDMRCPCYSGSSSWTNFASRIRRVSCWGGRSNRSCSSCYSRRWYHRHTFRVIQRPQPFCSCTANIWIVRTLCICFARTCAAFALIAVIQVQVRVRVKRFKQKRGKEEREQNVQCDTFRAAWLKISA